MNKLLIHITHMNPKLNVVDEKCQTKKKTNKKKHAHIFYVAT